MPDRASSARPRPAQSPRHETSSIHSSSTRLSISPHEGPGSSERSPLARRGSMLMSLRRSRTLPVRAPSLDSTASGTPAPPPDDDDIASRPIRQRRSVRELTRAVSITLLPVATHAPSHALTCEGGAEGCAAELRARFPSFAAMPYDANAPHSALNALALAHNAAQRELYELIRDLLPLCERAASGLLPSPHAQRTALRHLASWWGGFALFSDFVAHVQESVVARLYEKIAADERVRLGRRDVQACERARDRILDRTGLSRTLVLRAARETIDDGARAPRPATFRHVVRAINIVVGFLLETYQNSVSFAKEAEARLRRPKVSGIAVHVLRGLKQFDTSQRPIMVVILTRWMDDPVLIRSWTGKYLGLRAKRKLHEWISAHQAQREYLLDEIRAL